ncbi:MAG: glycosyltransferase [Candidatus Dadabacteria bacterium]|nr:glycosyltransferase [Candidatus Dadabacteria bacterium]
MSGKLISAAMIVRNEEKFLEGCLESLRGVVDEVVVVDTGSSDLSKDIALAYDARVFDFPWNGSFADARNEALGRSRGKWILYIDADERFVSGGRAAVEAELSRPGYAAHTVKFHPITGYTSYREYRIFLNDPRIRFEGVIHESMVAGMNSAAEEDGLAIGDSPFSIIHTGYDGELAHKHERNLPLLMKQIENDPGRMYLRWQLGVAMKGLGDVESAERTWTEALRMTRAKGPSNVTHDDSHAYYEMICLLAERGDDVGPLLEEALELFPDNYLLVWTRAKSLARDGRFEEAASLFESLLAVDPDSLTGPLAYNAKIFGELSHEPLAACYFKLGRLSESEAHYARASELDPDNPEYRTKLMFVRAMLGRAKTTA